MKLSSFLAFNGILFVAAGIAFAVYGPAMMGFFKVPELNIDSTTYWHVTAFARMFGAALFGYGFLLWAVSRAVDRLSAANIRSILMALLLGNLMATVVSLTEQSSIWYNAAGWVTSGVFALLTLAYGGFLVSRRSKESAEPVR
jgi:peptidoglycan/LPS O-acetylase OafA/YrhL